MRRPGSKPDLLRESLRTAGLAGGLGLGLGLMMVVGALAGHYLDQRWGTGPWLTLLGLFLGMGAGFWEVVTTIRRLGGET
jgi:ATP synthase protein I